MRADVVTARAVAPLDKLAGLAVGLVRPGGLMLAIKGAGAAAEVARARPALRRLGAAEVKVRSAGSGIHPAATVVTFTARPPFQPLRSCPPGRLVPRSANLRQSPWPAQATGPPAHAGHRRNPQPWTPSPRLTQPSLAPRPARRVASQPGCWPVRCWPVRSAGRQRVPDRPPLPVPCRARPPALPQIPPPPGSSPGPPQASPSNGGPAPEESSAMTALFAPGLAGPRSIHPVRSPAPGHPGPGL